MKPAPLLLFLPLLFPVCALAARPLTKPEVRADGRYEFRDNARNTKFRIATDELQQTGAAGSRRILISARDHLKNVQDTAKSMARSDRKYHLVAYPEGKPKTEANRRVVTPSVEVTLAEGMDPAVLGEASNAKKVKSFPYLPGYHVLEFNDALEALSAAEALAAVPGVSHAGTVLADNRFIPAYTPNDPLFGLPDTTRQFPNGEYPVFSDPTEEKVIPAPANWLSPVRMVQWYLNYTNSLRFITAAKTQIPAIYFSNYRVNSLPAFVEPDDYLLDGRGFMPFEISKDPVRLPPANGERGFPRYFELATDINVIPAWDEIGPPTVFNGITIPGTPLDGKDVKVSIVDDGIQRNHPDLTATNIISSWNYIEDSSDPTPPANQGINHGTGAAGLIAAKRDNSIGMAGIAPSAKLIGLRILGGFVPASDFADALTWTGTYNSPGGNPIADISVFPYTTSSSSDLVYLQPVVSAALKSGAETGRNRKGTVYVVPAGNEGEYHADANYFELSNSIYTITVGAVSDMGRRIIYSQPGASVQVVAPSSGQEMAPRIRTTNAVVANAAAGTVAVPANTLVPPLPLVVPATPQKRALGWTVSPDEYDNTGAWTRSTQQILTLNSVASSITIPPTTGGVTGFNYNYGGTSASCSMVTGVTALMLQANPALGYRDVMEILMRSARVVDPMMGEWQYNSLGIPFSHKYGAGLVDAAHAVRMAKIWKNLAPRPQIPLQRTLFSDFIPDDATSGYFKTIIPPNFRVEHVTVRLKVQHGRRGDLGIILTSPASGQADTPVESYLMVPHREDFSENIGNPAFPDGDGTESPGEYWTFMSVRHWGTSSSNPQLGNTGGGDWTLRVFDNSKQGITDYVGANSANPNAAQPENRVYCPVGNPTSTAEVPIKVLNAVVSFYGSSSDGLNEPPAIQTTAFPVKTNSSFAFNVQASTDLTGDAITGFPRAPIYDYRLRMIKAVSAETPDLEIGPATLLEHFSLYPNPVTTPADAAGKSPAYFRFDRETGLLTNEPYPGGPAFRPLPVGEWLLEIHATSIFGTTRRQVPFTVVKAITYPEWKALYFSPAEGGAADFDQQDPDLDGVPNLLEYTMGGIPVVREPDLFPPPVIGNDSLVFTYKADLSAQGFRVVPQFSTDPSLGWQDARGTLPPLAVLQTQDSSLQSWKVTVPISPGSKTFFRLKAVVFVP